VVEAQHIVSTRKLVDSVEEQEALEEMIDSAKPPRRDDGSDALHYLLYTPFRYPPLKHGSRFATRNEPSLYYGAVKAATAFAENAYCRLLFLDGTAADLGDIEVDVTAFRVRVRTPRGIDLTRSPFRDHERAISSPTRYASSQALGREMRAAGVEAFRYRSARDSGGGANVALFTPRAFASPKPDSFETWHTLVSRVGVEYTGRDYLTRRRHRFDRRDFEVKGTLPRPAP
jgi:hypothetical protein